MDRVSVDELEAQLAARLDSRRCDEQLLLDLANRARERRFPGVDAPAGSVDLAGAEAALFADQQDLTAADHEEQRRALARLPALPIHVVESREQRQTDPGREGEGT